MMKSKSTQVNTTFVYIGLFLIAGIFVLLFSRSTSPLYVYYTPDSSIFMSIGKQLLDGKKLYVDCFDHKGPLLFFYQAIAQAFIPGKTGVFIFQIVNMFLTLTFLYKTSDLITRSLYKNALVISTFLIYLRFTMGEGNQTEEYSLLFSFICLYLAFKYYYQNKSLSNIGILILSLCFSFVFWVRPNNTGVICACVAFVFLVHLKAKQWRFNFTFLHIFWVSFVIVSCIICFSFVYNRTIDEMVYAAFTFNIKYISQTYEYTTESMFRYIFFNAIVAIILLCGTVFLYRKERDPNIIVLSSLLFVFAFIPVNMRFGAHFYMALLSPVFSLGLMMLLRVRDFNRTQNRITAIASILITVTLCSSFFIRRDLYKEHDVNYIQCAQELVNKIPDGDKDKTFGYQVEAKLFLVTDLKPTFKYYFFQEWQGKFDNHILEAVNNNMESDNTLWVITQNDLMKKSTNMYAQKILAEQYNLHFENEHLCLYKRKDKQ